MVRFVVPGLFWFKATLKTNVKLMRCHKQRQSARRMRLSGCRARKSEDLLARGHAATDAEVRAASVVSHGFVGIALVDGEEQIGAVGELSRDRVFGRQTRPDALHDQVRALEVVKREVGNACAVVAYSDIAAALPSERFSSGFVRRRWFNQFPVLTSGGPCPLMA